MMGDRDYRSIIQNAINSIGDELESTIDTKDSKIIHVEEVVSCMRRSYYNRTDPIKIQRTAFSDLLTGLLRKMEKGSKDSQFAIDELTLKGKADMVIDDAVIAFRSSKVLPENPKAEDILDLNACLWMFDKPDGLIIYMTGDQKETSFSVSRDKKMFEEVIRRVRVFNNLLEEKKTPILEPSEACSTCQYYDRCYIKKITGKSISIKNLVGLNKD